MCPDLSPVTGTHTNVAATYSLQGLAPVAMDPSFQPLAPNQDSQPPASWAATPPCFCFTFVCFLVTPLLRFSICLYTSCGIKFIHPNPYCGANSSLCIDFKPIDTLHVCTRGIAFYHASMVLHCSCVVTYVACAHYSLLCTKTWAGCFLCAIRERLGLLLHITNTRNAHPHHLQPPTHRP